MTSEEHLRASDILAFRERDLSAEDHTAATRHLLRCAECRDQLPLPKADELWRAVMGSDEQAAKSDGVGSEWVSKTSYLAGKLFGQPGIRSAVVASFLLFAILGSWSLFLMRNGSLVNENLIAASAGNHSPYSFDPITADRPIRSEVPNTDVPASSPSSDRHDLTTESRRPSKATIAPEKRVVPKKIVRGLPPVRSLRRTDTRGNVQCGGQRSVGLEVKPTGEGLLLKWDKITGAISYQVYLSDLDERLIDQIETSNQTSYLVSAKLNEESVYQLRLIAKLESGERLVSESQTFKISSLAKGSQAPENLTNRKKTTASVRCAEVKQ